MGNCITSQLKKKVNDTELKITSLEKNYDNIIACLNIMEITIKHRCGELQEKINIIEDVYRQDYESIKSTLQELDNNLQAGLTIMETTVENRCKELQEKIGTIKNVHRQDYESIKSISQDLNNTLPASLIVIKQQCLDDVTKTIGQRCKVLKERIDIMEHSHEDINKEYLYIKCIMDKIRKNMATHKDMQEIKENMAPRKGMQEIKENMITHKDIRKYLSSLN